MGRSYWFECMKCGYRAAVSGRADRGLHCFVQTIICQDCRQLYDAVTRIRVPEPITAKSGSNRRTTNPPGRLPASLAAGGPPTLQATLNRLSHLGSRLRWVQFKPQCPVSRLHRIQSWEAPGKCPRCGLHLEKNVLPYRLWD